MDITKHRNTNMRIGAFDAGNSNHIRIEFEGEETLSIDLYDLPKEITQKLLLGFADESTSNFGKIEVNLFEGDAA